MRKAGFRRLLFPPSMHGVCVWGLCVVVAVVLIVPEIIKLTFYPTFESVFSPHNVFFFFKMRRSRHVVSFLFDSEICLL